METPDHLEDWINRRLNAAALPPEWPDSATAWRHLNRRVAKRPRPFPLWAAAAAAVGALILVLPAPRAAARQFWDRTVLGRILVLTADFVGGGGAAAGFLMPELQQRPDPQPVPSLADATRVAGFAPRLPGSDVFASAPRFSVADAVSATLRLRTPAIRYLVAASGGSAGDVPETWNGVVLDVRVGPILVADFDGVLLLQSCPFELIKPVDFDLERFYHLAFRALGMSETDSRGLSLDLAISPALLTVMPKEDRDLLHPFTTRSGNGVMIDEVYGPGKIVAVWSSADRLYALYPSTRNVSREFVMKVANALD